jgi:signal transduction histidine kinase
MYSGIFISGLLLLGGSFVLGIYHLMLYFQYREKVILAYTAYLISAALYIVVYLIAEFGYPQTGLVFVHYLKEVGSILTILGYTWFIFVALEQWREQYGRFFRIVRVSMVFLLLYCAFYIVAGIFGWKSIVITTILPYIARSIMFVIAFITVGVFFPKMKEHFLRMLKWGSVIYLAIVSLVVLAGSLPEKKLLGIPDMYLYFLGSFIDLVIFSMAMAYKVRTVLTHVMDMRMKISQDLHDDIGASLSSLQIYGTIAERTIGSDPVKATEMVRKISAQSKLVMDNMSDIVWSMKPVGYGAATFEAKIKNFGTELLRDKNIDLNYAIDAGIEDAVQEVQERKNILLVIKEALNNISKYSEATVASLKLYLNGGKLLLEISDNGVGFDKTTVSSGNGLRNMQSRIEELKGTVSIDSAKGKGTCIRITVPLSPAH